MYDMVVAGSSAPGLAKDISEQLGVQYSTAQVRRFPDGELHVELEDPVKDQEVIYVLRVSPHPNERLIEYMITTNLMNGLGAKRVTAVLPYLGYTRQDTQSHPREAVTVLTLMQILNQSGIDQLVSVDIHLHRLGLEDLQNLADFEVTEVTAIPEVAGVAAEGLDHPLILAPDVEATRWARDAAESLDTEYDVTEKHRVTPTEVEIKPKELDARGRDILIVDDIVSTGGTVVELANALSRQGAGEIHAAFTHPVFSTSDSISNIFDAGITELVSTNTIPSEFSVVNVTPIIAEALKG